MKYLISFIFFLILFNCKNIKKEIDFIEITEGFSMNPSLPRSGIKIDSDNNLFVCKEIMIKNVSTQQRHSMKYNYYQSKINFNEYKDLINKNFNAFKTKRFSEPEDATYFKIRYLINGEFYEKKFYEFELNLNQKKVLNKFIELKASKILKPIHKRIDFSTELLKETLPTPPPPPH